MRFNRQKVQLCPLISWRAFKRIKKDPRISIRGDNSEANRRRQDRSQRDHSFLVEESNADLLKQQVLNRRLSPKPRELRRVAKHCR